MVSRKKPQPFTRRKGGSIAGCLFPPSVSGLCSSLCIGFIFQPGFPQPSRNLATGSSQASFDSDCMALSTAHSQERSLIGPAWVSCSLLNQSTMARELAAVTGGPCQRHLSRVEGKALTQRPGAKQKLWPDQLIDSTNSSD